MVRNPGKAELESPCLDICPSLVGFVSLYGGRRMVGVLARRNDGGTNSTNSVWRPIGPERALVVHILRVSKPQPCVCGSACALGSHRRDNDNILAAIENRRHPFRAVLGVGHVCQRVEFRLLAAKCVKRPTASSTRPRSTRIETMPWSTASYLRASLSGGRETRPSQAAGGNRP
jgi:hypothetical protein